MVAESHSTHWQEMLIWTLKHTYKPCSFAYGTRKEKRMKHHGSTPGLTLHPPCCHHQQPGQSTEQGNARNVHANTKNEYTSIFSFRKENVVWLGNCKASNKGKSEHLTSSKSKLPQQPLQGKSHCKQSLASYALLGRSSEAHVMTSSSHGSCSLVE